MRTLILLLLLTTSLPATERIVRKAYVVKKGSTTFLINDSIRHPRPPKLAQPFPEEVRYFRSWRYEPDPSPYADSSSIAVDGFLTAVEAFLERKTRGGIWRIPRTRGPSLKLKYERTDTERILKVRRDIFVGRVLFLRVPGGEEADYEFTVDLSKEKGKVLGFKRLERKRASTRPDSRL